MGPSVTNSTKPISMNLDRPTRDQVQMRRGEIAPKEEDMNHREGSERTYTARSTVLLRDIPSHYSPESIIKSFTVNNIVPTSARPDVGSTWYVTFKKEDDAISAVSATRNQTIDGLPIKARIKSEVVLTFSKRPESSSNNNPQISPTHTSSQNPTQSYTNASRNGMTVQPGRHHYPPYPVSPSIPVPITYPSTYPHLPHSNPTEGSSPGHTTYANPPYYYTSPHPSHVPPLYISSKSSIPNHPPYTASPPSTMYGTYITTRPYGRGAYYGIESKFAPTSRNSLNPLHEPHYGHNRSRNIPKRIMDPKSNSKKNKGRGGYYPTREVSMLSIDMDLGPPFPPGPSDKIPIPYNEFQPLSTNETTPPDTKAPRPPCEGSRTFKEACSNGSMSEHGPTHMLPGKEFEASYSNLPIHHSYSDLSTQYSCNNYNNRNVNKTLHSLNKKNKKKTRLRRQEFDLRNGSRSLLSFPIGEEEDSKREKNKVISTWSRESFPALLPTKTKETDILTSSVSTKFTGYADALRQTYPSSSSPRRVLIVESTSSSHNLKLNDNVKNRRSCMSNDQIIEEIIPILKSLEVDKSNLSTNESLLDNPSLNVDHKKYNISEPISGNVPKCFIPTNLSSVESVDVTTISKNASSQKLSFSDAVRKQT